jgi:hypothetical protein
MPVVLHQLQEMEILCLYTCSLLSIMQGMSLGRSEVANEKNVVGEYRD